MPNLTLLNNIDHHALKINPAWSADLGDNYAVVPTFPAEFRRVQAYYPIVFNYAEQSQQFTPVALLGLDNNENLFIAEQRWQAGYIPACAECKPFYIGAGGMNGELSIHIDLDSPKLSETEGLPLFLPQGGNSEYINHIAELLGAIHHHLPEVGNFVSALTQHDLLEPFVLKAKLADGTHFTLDGFYTINEDKLAGLPAAALAELHQSGFLAEMYMVIASMSQLNRLIYTKNQRLGA